MKTIAEVAVIFGVHYNTIRNWLRNGEIRGIKVGNTIRIPDEEIERIKKGDK